MFVALGTSCLLAVLAVSDPARANTAALPNMQLTRAGTGINETVTVEAQGLYRLVFEAGDNWGCAQWYDLVNDPAANVNLTKSTDVGIISGPDKEEPGLFNMVWYGTQPNDPKLYMHAAKYDFPNTARSFTVLESNPNRVVVEAVSHPMLPAGVLDNLTVKVQYSIYPDGRIYIDSHMTAAAPQNITSEWRCAVMGLCDPPNTQSGAPDSAGWIRSTTTQNPYNWTAGPEKYIYAYWSKSTPAPYADFTKASVMLVPINLTGGNPDMVKQGAHGWTGFKRWYYSSYGAISMAAGETITQHYLLQLGAENSSILPNLSTSAVCNPIANAYIADPTPPPVQTYCLGDANGDGFVTFQDYIVLELNFGKSGSTWAMGDFNGDGVTNFKDYIILETNFGKSVPEPASVSLLLLSGVSLLRRKR